jgi:signal transduction histidine kinase
MPALVFPRLVPHGKGAGPFSGPKPRIEPPAPRAAPGSPAGPQSHSVSDTIDRLAHDARNILSGLSLYSELLAAPGVLTQPHAHYAQELEGIAESAAQILDRILEKIIERAPSAASKQPALPALAPAPVTDAAAELRHLQPLLAAIAGPAIRLSIATHPCPGRTALAVEDLTRILVNLVRNAADAMAAGGDIRINAQYASGASFPHSGYAIAPRSIVLTVADNGPGIPEALREQIFDIGFTTRRGAATIPGPTVGWPAPLHRGLGLGIVRNLIEAAGGTVRAVHPPAPGALFEITLPLSNAVTSGTYAMPHTKPFPADSSTKGCIEC